MTLLLTPRATEETSRVGEAARRRGMTVIQSTGWEIPELDPGGLRIYGGELFVQYACQQLGITLPAVDPAWLPALSPALLGRRVTATTLGVARGLPGPIFVKPIQEKSFAAAVYPSGSALPTLPDEEPVYVSDPVRFTREYRCFLANGVCRTGSLYAIGGRPAAPLVDDTFAAAAHLAERAWREVPTLPAAVVIDVGVLEGGALAIVEANSVAESALYGADAEVVVELLGVLFGG